MVGINCDREDQRKSEDTLMEQRKRKEEDAAHGENISIISWRVNVLEERGRW